MNAISVRNRWFVLFVIAVAVALYPLFAGGAAPLQEASALAMPLVKTTPAEVVEALNALKAFAVYVGATAVTVCPDPDGTWRVSPEGLPCNDDGNGRWKTVTTHEMLAALTARSLTPFTIMLLNLTAGVR